MSNKNIEFAEMKSKVCFVIPYFGHLPNYFVLFLKSCSYNEDFNWLLITDDRTPYDYPDNFRVIYMSYQENYALIQSKFDFPIVLDRPYKLCDYKPAYGYIYSDYLKEYSHWGHCDTDVLMGNLGRFITDSVLSQYDKLFCLGHMTIYKNTEENNKIFMNDLHGKSIYKNVYSTSSSCCFDEVWKDENNVDTLFQQAGKSILSKDYSLNIGFDHTKFVRVIYVGRNVPNNGHGYVFEDYRPSVYVWDKGHIYRYALKDGTQLEREEYMYLHLQKRKMKVKVDAHSEVVKIVPNSFLPLEVAEITPDNFRKIRKWDFNNHYWLVNILPKIKSLKKKMGLCCPV